MLTEAVHTHHRRIFVLVLHKGGDGSHADAHGSNEDEGIEMIPLGTYLSALDGLGVQLTLQNRGDVTACLADGDDGYFLHRRIVMG